MKDCARCSLQSTSEADLVLAWNFLASTPLSDFWRSSAASRSFWSRTVRQCEAGDWLNSMTTQTMNSRYWNPTDARQALWLSFNHSSQFGPANLVGFRDFRKRSCRGQAQHGISLIHLRSQESGGQTLHKSWKTPEANVQQSIFIWFCDSEIILLGGLNHGVTHWGRCGHCGHSRPTAQAFWGTKWNRERDWSKTRSDMVPMSMVCTSNVDRQACGMKVVQQYALPFSILFCKSLGVECHESINASLCHESINASLNYTYYQRWLLVYIYIHTYIHVHMHVHIYIYVIIRKNNIF